MTPASANASFPNWVKLGPPYNEHLSDLLTFASTNYGRHTEWFLRHREAGIKNLGAAIAAEAAVAGFYFAAQRDLPAIVVSCLLFFLALVALLFAISTIRSCDRGYRAALESVLLITKVTWAMGLVSDVAVDGEVLDAERCPVRSDVTLYPRRWWVDAANHETTERFLDSNLANRGNTWFWTKITVYVFCVGSLLFGFGTGILILWRSIGAK